MDPRAPNHEQFKWFVLGDAVEDMCGLWEPYWTLRGNSTEFVDLPSLSDPERQAMAEGVLRELNSEGLIRFFRSESGKPADADDEQLALTHEDVDSALASENWRSLPVQDTTVWFVATEKGERTYESLPKTDS